MDQHDDFDDGHGGHATKDSDGSSGGLPARLDDDTLRLAVEEAALRAWPGVEQEYVMGWEARFAGGHTKRANSASPLPPLVLLPERMDACEAAYERRGQPAIFKIPDFLDPAVDRLLASRGYDMVDPTLVLVLPLDDAPDNSAADAETTGDAEGRGPLPLSRWLPAWADCNGAPEPHPAHRMILENRLGHAYYTCVPCPKEEAGADPRYCSCGIGVPDTATATADARGGSHGPLFGIFDVATREAARRRGHATRLVRALLAAGRAAGARLCYLQVVETNLPARALYASLGFRPLYRYWYRVRPASALAPAGPGA
ncbi:MAG: GNAT family N-acetyltransferase [Desulfovibrionaceae bacterium]